MKSWEQDVEIINLEIYPAHNEGKSVVADHFIRTLECKIYKYKTSISKNVYINEEDNIVS